MSFLEEWGELRGQRASGIVLTDLGAVYVPIPKVACTSLKTVCAGILGLHGNVHFEVAWPLVELELLRAEHPDAFVFSFVRNPWDRLLSCFRSKIVPGRQDEHYRDGVEFNFWKYGSLFRGDMSFREFVQATASIPDEEADIHFGSQYRHVMDADGAVLVDFLGRFESLARDFRRVCDRLGITDVALAHLHRTDGATYATYYDPHTRDLVAERWARDVQTFAYSFESSP
jgi:hypothetical protein